MVLEFARLSRFVKCSVLIECYSKLLPEFPDFLKLPVKLFVVLKGSTSC